MSEQNNTVVFAKIEEETKRFLSGDKLKNALDLLVYLKESGRTWMFTNGGHPEFYYMDELNCLLAYSIYNEEQLNEIRRAVFGKVYDNACCNVFQFGNPDAETLKKIIKLMELQKYIISESKK